MSFKLPDGSLIWCSRGAASILQIGRNNMLKRLRERGVFNKDNVPTSRYLGYFRVQRKKVHGFDIITTYFISEGIELARVICKDLPRNKKALYKQDEVPITALDFL